MLLTHGKIWLTYQLSKTVLTSQLYGKMFHQAVVRVHQLYHQAAKQTQAV